MHEPNFYIGYVHKNINFHKNLHSSIAITFDRVLSKIVIGRCPYCAFTGVIHKSRLELGTRISSSLISGDKETDKEADVERRLDYAR